MAPASRSDQDERVPGRARVAINGVTTSGWSERVFAKDEGGRYIAVTTAFQDPEMM